MASQDSQKPQGLPNPYGLPKPTGGLPNPYAQAVVASAAPVRYTEEQAKAEQLRKAHGIYLLRALSFSSEDPAYATV
jgi:splicing factor 45